MTRDILVRISGLQALDGESHDVEMITTGDYFLKNGKHYVIYDEIMEGFEGNVHNTIKITPEMMDQTRYATPLGDMVVELTTTRIHLDEQEDSLRVQVDYSLGLNYQHVSDCSIVIDICSRNKARLQL